jgi:hypothetical protein
VKDHAPEKESNCEWQSVRTDWRLVMLQREVEHLPRTRAAIHNIRTTLKLELEARGQGAELTINEAQQAGRACVRCGREDSSLVPVGYVDGCQVFACDPSCPGI